MSNFTLPSEDRALKEFYSITGKVFCSNVKQTIFDISAMTLTGTRCIKKYLLENLELEIVRRIELLTTFHNSPIKRCVISFESQNRGFLANACFINEFPASFLNVIWTCSATKLF